MHDLTSDSISSEMMQFDRPYITSYEWPVVTMSLSCITSEIDFYNVRDCRDLEKSFSFSIKVEITCRVCFPISCPKAYPLQKLHGNLLIADSVRLLIERPTNKQTNLGKT